jgi:hypothetical protein
VTATLDPTRYRFDGWSCPGGTPSGGSGEVITVTNLRGDQGCSANYSLRTRIEANVDPNWLAGGGAFCTAEPVTLNTTVCWVNPGGQVAVGGRPNAGYLVSYIRCSDGQYADPRVWVPTADTTCTVTFEDQLL